MAVIKFHQVGCGGRIIHCTVVFIRLFWLYTEIDVEDNQGTYFIANNDNVGTKKKYIDVCYYFICDLIRDD